MKYEHFFNAYDILSKMSGMQFQARDAYRIFRLLKSLEPAYEFGVKREREMVGKYNGVVEQDGSIRFIHGEDAESQRTGEENMRGFVREINELHDMDIDCDFEPITLSYDAFGEQTITPREIALLDGFVSFE